MAGNGYITLTHVAIGYFLNHMILSIYTITETEEHTTMTYPISCIFTIDGYGGIGKDGSMPWYLPADLQYFKEVTTHSKPGTKNVCIMGRKTWESIPDKFRPLSNRINVILSTTLDEGELRSKHKSDDIYVFNMGLKEALVALAIIDNIDKIFVIGGRSLLVEAMNLPNLHHVYVTHIHDIDFKCDTFVSLDNLNDRVIYNKDDSISKTIIENDITYTFERYARVNYEEQQYLNFIKDIILNGTHKSNRTGIDTISIFGYQMRYSLRNGKLPLLTTKRVFWKGIVEELMWFIKGSTNELTLREKGVKIWQDNGTRAFLDSRGLTNREEGDLGPIYGFQWRHFGAEYIDCHTNYSGKGKDQLMEVIDTIKNDPNSRRIILSAWNPLSLDDMALPPCHVLCQFYVANGELSCQMYQRSCDMGLGVPFNIASYSLLTILIAHICNLKPGDFIHTLGDAHIYSNHIKPLKEQLMRQPRPFPTLNILRHHANIEDYTINDLQLSGYDPYPSIKMDMVI